MIASQMVVSADEKESSDVSDLVEPHVEARSGAGAAVRGALEGVDRIVNVDHPRSASVSVAAAGDMVPEPRWHAFDVWQSTFPCRN